MSNNSKQLVTFRSSARLFGKASPWMIFAVLALAGAGGAWWWKHKPQDGAQASSETKSGGSGGRRFGNGQGVQPVSVMPVNRRDVHAAVNAIGTFTAANTAVVHAQVSGVLQKLNFKEGQQVKAGQTLAQIDPRAFQASLSQSEGGLARDKAQLDNARVDLDRYRGLLAKDALAKQQVDTQEALVHQLEGTVKVDQASVDSARLQLTYTHVLAPISGRVGLKQVDVGNVVQPGDANGIVSITQTRPMALVFAVPSNVLPKIAVAMKANQVLQVQALDRNSHDVLAQGHVSSIDNAIDVTTDTIKIKAVFPNEDDVLFPNQSVSVSLQVETLHDVLTVPPAAVLRGTKGYYVYVVGDDNKVATKVIKPGPVDGNWMAVEGPLNVGERVVIDGVDRLRDGAKVEVIAADPKQRAGARSTGDGASGGRQGRLANLPPEIAQKIKAMTPDERRAWFQQHRGELNKAP
ncbi:MAG: MdtA/MuxA family multidrug efflux RND transporter periplasmic adaptor subunit [Aquabacterium sp.]|uniref:MdtA/MuxA family multidrug efflux RND transporter periplasmic adaptor subunit n=1 Tax=Aquabacterium sp. TaxID=1872578 RepID=UPI0012003484|nr:MdtA/MuxA family multidrug efflux RND transporter periplasmic adaptor subunit [Aquabacterium sp.]TAK96829.1 MAG: MdtA/MuxA family multidrug efflux RND transporter periplasmic adaptor subunit [Aquabacterium sp.]